MSNSDERRARPWPDWAPYGLVAVAICALIIAVSALAVWADAQRSRQAAEITTRNLALVLAEQLGGLFARADALALSGSHYYADALRSGDVDKKRIDDFLANEMRKLPQTQSLRILDQNGILRFGNDGRSGDDFSDRRYFTAARDDASAAPVFDGPHVGRLSGTRVLILARRLVDGDGRFVGVVSVVLRMDGIERMFSSLDVGPSGAVVLRYLDMAMVARHPHLEVSADSQDIRRVSPELRAMIETQPNGGTYIATASVDSTPRIYSYRRLDDYPFYLIVGRATTDYLADWRRNAAIVGLLALACIAVTLASAWRLYRSSRRLVLAETRWRFALEGAAQGVWDTDLRTRRCYWSPRISELLGYAPGEYADTLDQRRERVHPEDLPRVLETVNAHLRGETASYVAEHRLRRKDGNYVWIESRGMVIARGPHGEPLRATGTDTDISERKRNELQLVEARREAESANRAKSAFLANMSHELRTPMNAIMGMTALLLRRVEDPALRDPLGKIEQASRHLLDVINDILDISKVEAGRFTLECIDFSPGEVAERLSSLVAPRAAEKGLRFSIEIEPRLQSLRFRGDPVRLAQVLINLAGNAVKFTEQGGVTVRIALEQEDERLSLLRCEVVDSGIGIAGDTLPRLFSAFEQADTSMTRRYGGTGLGLAISKRLVHIMGGQIGVSSAPDAGSTFWFTVRLERAPDQAQADVAAPAADVESLLKARHSGTRVLLAEDNPINQEIARDMLEYVGLAVDVAADGAQAVDLAAANAYALILMDVQMPRMNGLDATRAIRRLPGHAQTPIVAMTANAFEDDRRQCLDAGMDEHIHKPVEPETLYAALLGRLDARATPRASRQDSAGALP